VRYLRGVAVPHDSVDIAIAVSIDGGLITPVVRGAHAMSLTAIGGEVRQLAGRAREGKLKPHEYTGACHFAPHHLRGGCRTTRNTKHESLNPEL